MLKANTSKYQQKFAGFEKVNNKIVYAPLNLEVINPQDKQDKLAEILNDDATSLGKRIYKLYKYIQSKYIGITRKDVQQYAEFQSEYQLTQLEAHSTNKLVISKFPNQLYGQLV
jgi:hypothetical protein